MKHFSPTRVHKSQFWPFSTEQGRCFFHCGCMPGTGAIRWGDISFRTRPRRPIEPPILTHRTRDQQTGGTGVMGTEGHGRGAGGRRRGPAGLRADAPSHTQQHGAAGVEGAGGTGGPGRGAGERRQGQGGPRDRPLRAAGSRVAISRAGRRPPAHTAARPFKAGHTAPGTPVGPQATPEIRRVRKRHRHNGRKETPTAPGTP